MYCYHIRIKVKDKPPCEVKVYKEGKDQLVDYILKRFPGENGAITSVKVLSKVDVGDDISSFVNEDAIMKARENGIPSYKQDLSFADRMNADRLSTTDKEERLIFLKKITEFLPNISWKDRWVLISKSLMKAGV